MHIRNILLDLLVLMPLASLVSGHGYVTSPRARNTVAAQDGTSSSQAGVPPREFCPHCLNRKGVNDQCGISDGANINYSTWLDSTGRPMAWNSQAVYRAGDTITVEVTLTANHGGHFDLFVCPNGRNPTRACFDSNPATLVRDELYGGPVDSRYPERAYVYWPNRQNPGSYRFTYRLPQNVVGEQVLMQWRYVTANSCIPRGYRDGAIRDALTRLGSVWSWNLPDCGPLNETGEVPNTFNPEQFWNCAEITIRNGGVPPTPTPGPPRPTPTQPTPTPPTGGGPTGTCGGGNRGNGRCSDSSMCCSMYGWCGTSPAHCAGTGTEVGTCGGGNRGNGICEDTSLCCSQWGWCGRSSAHCNGRRGLRASKLGQE